MIRRIDFPVGAMAGTVLRVELGNGRSIGPDAGYRNAAASIEAGWIRPMRNSRTSRRVRTPIHSGTCQVLTEHCTGIALRDHKRRCLYEKGTSPRRCRFSRFPRCSRWRRSSRSKDRTRLIEAHRRGCHRHARSTRSFRWSSRRRHSAARKSIRWSIPVRSPRRAGGRQFPRRSVEKNPLLSLRLRGAPVESGSGSVRIGGGDEPAQQGDWCADACLRIHQKTTRTRRLTFTRSNARSA